MGRTSKNKDARHSGHAAPPPPNLCSLVPTLSCVRQTRGMLGGPGSSPPRPCSTPSPVSSGCHPSWEDSLLIAKLNKEAIIQLSDGVTFHGSTRKPTITALGLYLSMVHNLFLQEKKKKSI